MRIGKIKDILYRLEYVIRNNRDKANEEAFDKAVAEIKEELMRVIPTEPTPVKGLKESKSEFYRGFSNCRSQIIQAITKLCEEK